MAIPFEDSINRTTATPRFTDEVFADLTARNAYAGTLRYEGMTCYVESEAKNYQLQGGITNSDWVKIGAGGGGGGSGLNFRPHNISGAVEDTITEDIKAFKFVNANETIIASMALSENWVSQKQIRFLTCSDYSLTKKYAFTVRCILDKKANAISGSNYHDSTSADISTLHKLEEVILNITDTDGTINSLSPQVGDLITIKIFRVAATLNDTDQSSYVLPETIGVEDV